MGTGLLFAGLGVWEVGGVGWGAGGGLVVRVGWIVMGGCEWAGCWGASESGWDAEKETTVNGLSRSQPSRRFPLSVQPL